MNVKLAMTIDSMRLQNEERIDNIKRDRKQFLLLLKNMTEIIENDSEVKVDITGKLQQLISESSHLLQAQTLVDKEQIMVKSLIASLKK